MAYNNIYPEHYRIADNKNPDRVHKAYIGCDRDWHAQYNMLLPDGLTCNDCIYRKRCSSLYDQKLTATSCQWHPSRFSNIADI